MREPRRRTRLLQVLGLVAWCLAVAGAFTHLWAYKLAPGPNSAQVASWPAGTSIALAPDRPTLLVFVHPRCACTRATLATLRTVLSVARDRVRAYVVFRGGAGELKSWRDSDIWAAAAGLPVTVLADPDGAEARRFGATTSGHVSLYTPDHRLRFAGGITPGRGHVGDNSQLDRLLALVSGSQGAGAGVANGAVFGCGLHDE